MRSSNPQYSLTKWDYHFFRMAQECAVMSKDPSTKVGCIIADDRHRIMGSGFNGFPRGVVDSIERLSNREVKYEMVVHAEVNAVLNSIVEPRGGIMYCLAFPCPRCAAVIIQAGIKQVLAGYNPDYEKRWEGMLKISKEMLTEANIPFYHCTELDRPFMHPSHCERFPHAE